MRAHAPILLAALLTACAQGDRTGDLKVLENWTTEENGVKVIDLDYADALDSGFVVPSVRQVPEGRFSFQFTVNDTTGTFSRFRYKLYYLNDSYKFAHAAVNGDQHPLAHENFYGSWEDPKEGFRLTTPADERGLVVKDRFRIRGDPRDEPEHLDSLGRTARWSRNPRVGLYRFMVVVMPESHFQHSPPPRAVCDISARENGLHVDPFWYWLHGPGSQDKMVRVLLADERLHVRARPDLGAGVHIRSEVPVDGVAFTANCGNSPELFNRAPFEQFIHYVDPSTRFENIPLIADVLSNEYTPADHDRYRCLFPADQMVQLRPMTTGTPCATVTSDPERKRIQLRNPASSHGNWRKENVGIRARHGLAYGKYRVKCKLTRLLNDSDMWVGVTNAIWLINDGAPGGFRRPCEKDGYLKSYYGGDGDQRVPRVEYSEIDFEILKTAPYCPQKGFPPSYPQQLALPNERTAWTYSTSEVRTDRPGQITVACTNWDMACHSPPRFGKGCQPMDRNGQTFVSHRWDENYRALTQKSEASDKELFGGDHYWFEIDWRPEEIIWRIGPELDQLREVGYMDRSITEISNVQMLLIITQEYHNTRWWPGTPYEQGFIPFPAKDLVGEILEISVE